MAGPQELWQRLGSEGVEVTGFIRLRINHITACRLYAARAIASGLEAIILDVEKAAIPAGTHLPRTRGFELRAVALHPGRGGRCLLLLTLLEDRYRDVFQALGEDAVGQLEGCTTEPEAVRQLLSRLGRWQRFLQQHEPEGLSVSERRGLFGELIILRHLMSHRVEPVAAVDSWRGALGANHDFQFPSGSIEVKTTAAVTPTTVRISNARQLDDSGVAALMLVLVVIDESESLGQSLPSIIDDIGGRLSGRASTMWLDRLTAAGYLEVQRHLYDSPGYLVRDLRYYLVASGFPRLTESDLPDGVSEVAYSVALAALKPFRCEGIASIDLPE
jgi:hypothetical protein